MIVAKPLRTKAVSIGLIPIQSALHTAKDHGS